jgi:hypothetical protein
MICTTEAEHPTFLGTQPPKRTRTVCCLHIGRDMSHAHTESSALIVAENGTGKELMARAIHNLSTRRGRAFVKLNCAKIPQGRRAGRAARVELTDSGRISNMETGFRLDFRRLTAALQERRGALTDSRH